LGVVTAVEAHRVHARFRTETEVIDAWCALDDRGESWRFVPVPVAASDGGRACHDGERGGYFVVMVRENKAERTRMNIGLYPTADDALDAATMLNSNSLGLTRVARREVLEGASLAAAQR
jgi:hypothetical protein